MDPRSALGGPKPISRTGGSLFKNTIKAGGSTATKMWTGWMDGWVIPLRLLRLLEHLAVLKIEADGSWGLIHTNFRFKPSNHFSWPKFLPTMKNESHAPENV